MSPGKNTSSLLNRKLDVLSAVKFVWMQLLWNSTALYCHLVDPESVLHTEILF